MPRIDSDPLYRSPPHRPHKNADRVQKARIRPTIPVSTPLQRSQPPQLTEIPSSSDVALARPTAPAKF